MHKEPVSRATNGATLNRVCTESPSKPSPDPFEHCPLLRCPTRLHSSATLLEVYLLAHSLITIISSLVSVCPPKVSSPISLSPIRKSSLIIILTLPASNPSHYSLADSYVSTPRCSSPKTLSLYYILYPTHLSSSICSHLITKYIINAFYSPHLYRSTIILILHSPYIIHLNHIYILVLTLHISHLHFLIHILIFFYSIPIHLTYSIIPIIISISILKSTHYLYFLLFSNY